VLDKLQFGQVLLATVGAIAPFVGLLGTVWGIYHALIGIAAAGQISIDKVAGPVGEALIMTAAGLAVAIPAVLGYNVFGRLIGRIEADLEGFARDLRELLTHSPASPTSPDSGGAVPAAFGAASAATSAAMAAPGPRSASRSGPRSATPATTTRATHATGRRAATEGTVATVPAVLTGVAAVGRAGSARAVRSWIAQSVR